jgi:hypothetical protein
MTFLPSDIVGLVNAPKLLLSRPQWDDKSDPRNFVFTVPLSVDGIVVGGFELRARVSKQHVDKDAFMQLEYTKGARDRLELVRLQWRPFETHTNKAWGPPGCELQSFNRQSHHHTFSDNYIPEEKRMRGKSLPAAIAIDPDPQTLSDFVAFSGQCLRISNIHLVEVPEASVDMFWVQK